MIHADGNVDVSREIIVLHVIQGEDGNHERRKKHYRKILSAIASNEVLQMWRLHLDLSFHLDTQHR